MNNLSIGVALQAMTLDNARASMTQAAQSAAAPAAQPVAQADVILQLSAAAQQLTES